MVVAVLPFFIGSPCGRFFPWECCGIWDIMNSSRLGGVAVIVEVCVRSHTLRSWHQRLDTFQGNVCIICIPVLSRNHCKLKYATPFWFSISYLQPESGDEVSLSLLWSPVIWHNSSCCRTVSCHDVSLVHEVLILQLMTNASAIVYVLFDSNDIYDSDIFNGLWFWKESKDT